MADGMRWHGKPAKTGRARAATAGARGASGAGGARGRAGAVPPALQPPTGSRISMD